VREVITPASHCRAVSARVKRRALDSAEHNDAEETAARYQLAAAKDADPDISILIATKAEYAKLH